MKFYSLNTEGTELSVYAVSDTIYFAAEVYPFGVMISMMETKFERKTPNGTEEISKDDFKETVSRIERLFDIDLRLRNNITLF